MTTDELKPFDMLAARLFEDEGDCRARGDIGGAEAYASAANRLNELTTDASAKIMDAAEKEKSL